MKHSLRQPTGHKAGFSLIELLVVIIIIGVAAGAVRLALVQPDPLTELERSAQQLAYRFGQVQDRVLLSGQEQGLTLAGKDIQFLTWRDGKPRSGEPDIVWEPNEQAPAWQAPEDVELLLELEERWTNIPAGPPEDALDWQPLILLEPSESYQPTFKLYLKPLGLEADAILIEGDGFNRPEVRRVTL